MRFALALLALAACGPVPLDVNDPMDTLVALERVSCDPEMSVFPVGDAHNIGYDHASCGTGTCRISCPDAHANSDWGGSHHGIDVFAYQGAPLVAVADATVTAVGTVSSTSGLRVRLRDACGWEYYYGHMDTSTVAVGQTVRAGDLIGTMGRTGTQSTHLHFNVSPDGAYYSDINPFDLLRDTSPTACDQPAVEPEPEPEPEPVEGCGVVGGTTVFGVNQSLDSCDGRFSLIQQGDGNLVLYKAGGVALWSSKTHGKPGATTVMQDDGNLVIYLAGRGIWSTGTHGNPGAVLAVQDDGNLVIYSASGRALWNTGTHGK